MRKSIAIWFMVVLAALCGFGSFYALVNFESAKTSDEIIAAGGKALPTNWEVAVNSHGKYYEWYSKSLHPTAFAASVAGLAGSVILFAVAYQLDKRSHRRLR